MLTSFATSATSALIVSKCSPFTADFFADPGLAFALPLAFFFATSASDAAAPFLAVDLAACLAFPSPVKEPLQWTIQSRTQQKGMLLYVVVALLARGDA